MTVESLSDQRVVPAATLDAQVIPAGSPPPALHIAAHMILTQEHRYLNSVWRVQDQQRALDCQLTFSQKDYGDGIIYLGIPTFERPPDSIYSAIKKAERSQVPIVDLRGNHGGRVDTELAFLAFLPSRPAS